MKIPIIFLYYTKNFRKNLYIRKNILKRKKRAKRTSRKDVCPTHGRGDHWSSADVQCTPLRINKFDAQKTNNNPRQIFNFFMIKFFLISGIGGKNAIVLSSVKFLFIVLFYHQFRLCITKEQGKAHTPCRAVPWCRRCLKQNLSLRREQAPALRW